MRSIISGTSALRSVLVAAVTGLLLAGGLSLVTAAPAQAADSPRCVSRAEFRQVRKGMPIKRVHRIFDIRGKQSVYLPGYPGPHGWPAEQWRDYRPCSSRWGYVQVDFERRKGVWRMVRKSAFWGIAG